MVGSMVVDHRLLWQIGLEWWLISSSVVVSVRVLWWWRIANDCLLMVDSSQRMVVDCE